MNRFSNLWLVSLFLWGQAAGAAEEFSSIENAQLAQKVETAETSVAAPLNKLQAAVKQFRSEAGEPAWLQVSEALKAYLQQANTMSVEPQFIAGLNELGVKLVASGNARVWLFPQVEQSHGAFVQWREIKAHPQPQRRSRRRQAVIPPTVIYHLSYITVPANVLLKDAKLLDAGGERYLLLAGADNSSHNMWLKSYHATADGWKENNYPLSAIPPFLLNNLSGKVLFNGSELILAVDTGRTKTTAAGVEEPLTYKIALRLVDGRYTLDGKLIPDSPQSVVHQFAHAIQSGRIDVAKAWLADPSLANIPRYLGLSNKASAVKLVNLSGAPAGVYRFRWVTFDKDDLIVDVTRSKMQWVIKAIFIAPADPVWQKIAKNLPAAN